MGETIPEIQARCARQTIALLQQQLDAVTRERDEARAERDAAASAAALADAAQGLHLPAHQRGHVQGVGLPAPDQEPPHATGGPAMSDNNGWPDAARPGVPLNPERDGWHWLQAPEGQPWCWFWMVASGKGAWCDDDTGDFEPPEAVAEMRYIGPCLTPSDVAAREAQARREALEEALRAVEQDMRGERVAGGDGGTYTVRLPDIGRVRRALLAAEAQP